VAAEKGHGDIIQLLRRRGCNVQQPCFTGETPAFAAAEYGHHAVLRQLCNAPKFDPVQCASSDGCTPLYVAAQGGHEACVRILHSFGCDVNAILHNGRTASFAAAQQGQEGCLRLLVQMGADISTANNTGVTPLKIAHALGHTACVSFLKESLTEQGKGWDDLAGPERTPSVEAAWL
jgi:ankyrin repeat protein